MKNIILFTFLLVLIWGCDEKIMGPIISEPGAPGVVTDIIVSNISGGAILEYKIPNDNDLLYVKAAYRNGAGKAFEVKASMYEKSLVVKGFNDVDNSNEYDVTLTCFDRSNNESVPVIVKIKPEVSPLQKVKNSITLSEAFGGARYTWKNEEEEPITFFFLADTVKTEGEQAGPLVETRIINTKQASGEYISRGFPNKPREFALVLKDNYGNITEQIKPAKILTPMKEEELDKSLMRVFTYGETPVEDKWNYWEGQPGAIVDGVYSHTSCAISYQSPYPRHMTIDLGKPYKLSRYVWFQRDNGANWIYSYGNPKTWYAYARSTPPKVGEEITEDKDGDGLPDWTNYWTRIDNYEIIKPSGLPVGQLSQEDKDAAKEGHNFDFPLDLEPMRYIRYGITSNFDGSGWCNWSEIDFFGIEL